MHLVAYLLGSWGICFNRLTNFAQRTAPNCVWRPDSTRTRWGSYIPGKYIILVKFMPSQNEIIGTPLIKTCKRASLYQDTRQGSPASVWTVQDTMRSVQDSASPGLGVSRTRRVQDTACPGHGVSRSRTRCAVSRTRRVQDAACPGHGVSRTRRIQDSAYPGHGVSRTQRVQDSAYPGPGHGAPA